LPGRPLYLRQLRQRLKAIAPSFDEQRYGLRGTLDLLHHAQREGLIKLLRDHKGVWRIHPLGVASPAPSDAPSEPEVSAETSLAPDRAAEGAAEGVSVTETIEEEPADAEIPSLFDVPEPMRDTASRQETQSSPSKGRKPRTTKTASSRPGRRKLPSRRKSGAPAEG
jgi:hypothetical protein